MDDFTKKMDKLVVITDVYSYMASAYNISSKLINRGCDDNVIDTRGCRKAL